MAGDIKLGITIRADGSAQVAGELDKIKQAVGGAGKAAEGTNRQFASMAAGLGSLRGAIASLGLAALVKDMVDTVKQVQVLDIRLKGLTTSASDYAQAQKFISEVSRAHHKDNLALADSYSKLLTIENAGLITRKQANDLMIGMSNAQSKTGATTAQLQQSMYGLSQALGSGVVHMEELNQVTEPMPGLLNQIAASAGVSVGEFRKLVAEGQMTSEQFGVVLVQAFAAYEGAAEAAGDTLVAKQTDLQNAWTDLARVMETPINEVLTPVLQAVSWAIRGLVQDARDLQAVWDELAGMKQGFDDIKAGGMRPPGYVAKKKANSSEQSKANAEAADIAKQSAAAQKQTWEWLDEAEETYVKKSVARTKTHVAGHQARAAAHQTSSRAIVSEAQREADALQANYQRMAESLAREAALKGDSSRLAALEYDLAAGALSKLTEAQKLYLLQATSEIENARINAKIATDKKTEMDQLIDKYKQLTLSAREYYQFQLTGKGIAPDQQGDLLAQYDKNAGLDRANAEVDAGIAKLESYTNSINETSNAWADMGETATEATDRTLGGINKVIGITKNYIKQISDIGIKQMENETRAKNIEYLYPGQKRTKEIEEYYKIKEELDAESLVASMTAIRQVTQAQANMYEEGTAAANIAKVANLAAIAAEFAAQWQLLTVRAAAAIANQGGGDTYTAFARIAAMMALMGSVISMAGGSSSFSGISGKPPTGTKTTGTTLGGGKDDQSESATNIADLLKDIHAEEYLELRGINKGVAALSDAITGAITGIFRFGGLKDFKVSGLGTVTTVKSLIPTITSNMVNQLLFGKTKTSIVGGGIEAAATQMNEILEGAMMDMRQYLTIETKKSGGLFGKKSVKYSTKYGPLDDDISNGITSIFESAGKVMLQAADSLGEGLADRVRDYIIPSFQIELRGLNAEDAVKKVNDLVSALLDQMSEAVFGDIIGEYQKLGEGMLETAIRIVAEVAIVRDSISTTGQSLASDAILIADSLVQAAGGIEEFQTQFDQFYDKFFTDVEKQARLTERLAGTLAEVFPPETISTLGEARSAYRAVMEALDLTNALDRERYSLLLSLADAADQYYSALEEGQRNLADGYYTGLDSVLNAQEQAYQDHLAATEQAVTDAMSSLQKAVSAEKKSLTTAYNAQVKQTQGAIDKLKDSVSKLTSISNALKSAMAGLASVDLVSSRSSAQDTLRSLLSTLRGGGIPDQDVLQKALNVVAQPSEGLFSSFVDYQRDFFKTAIDIDTMSKLADAQLAKQKSALQIAEDQLEFMKLAHEQQLQRLDDMIEQGQGMIDAMNGVSDTVTSVSRAMSNLKTSISNAQTASAGGGVNVSALAESARSYTDPAQGTIAALYSGLLGRAPDTGGLDYWTSVLKSGQTVQSIADSFKASQEYQAIKAIRGYATGGDHPGGWRLVGEQGPELEFTPPSHIVNNADSRKLLSYDDLIIEIKSLRADIRAGNNAVAQNTKETAKQLKKWDIDGMPAVTT